VHPGQLLANMPEGADAPAELTTRQGVVEGQPVTLRRATEGTRAEEESTRGEQRLEERGAGPGADQVVAPDLDLVEVKRGRR